jgi:hypothetical protein
MYTKHLFLLGIEVLLEEGVYEAAYPLHDQLVPDQDASDPANWNDRMVDDYLRKSNNYLLNISF